MTAGSKISALLLAAALLVAAVLASSHSEAPGTAAVPGADITDLYAFMSYEEGKEDNVVMVMNVHPLQAPFAGPNYYSISDKHYFELYIDNDGDAREDIVFQFQPGNSLGGSTETFVTVDPQDHLGDACPPMNLIKENTTAPAGLELDVNGTKVAVPLKFIGLVNETTKGDVLNWNQYYTLNKITGLRTSSNIAAINKVGTTSNKFDIPFTYAGEKSFGSAADYKAYADNYMYEITIPDCQGSSATGRVFVGPRKESFSVNLGGIFDLINFNPVPQIPGAIQNSEENNSLRNSNVNAFVIEMPKRCVLASSGSDVFGVWAGSRDLLHFENGTHTPTRQFSRLGNPLINEVVIGLRDKAMFNADEPVNDAANGFAPYVTHPTLPAIVNLLFLDTVNNALGATLTTLAPNTPRNDLVTTFLTGIPGVNAIKTSPAVGEYMRLNTTIAPVAAAQQNNMGVIAGDNAGFPNGRRPGDDVVDIALRVMMGRLCHLGLGLCEPADAPVGTTDFLDGAPQNAQQFSSEFPFLVEPLPGYVTPTSASPAATAAFALAFVF